MTSKSLIETNRLFLRELSPDDIQPFYQIFSDPETMKYASTGPLSIEQTAQQILEYIEEGKKHKFGVCALVLKKTGAVIGYCGLEWHWMREKWQPELVYCLDREFWGKGLATEAAKAIKEHVDNVVGISNLVSLIRIGNERSIRLAEKLGAVLDGEVIIHGIRKLKYVYPKAV